MSSYSFNSPGASTTTTTSLLLPALKGFTVLTPLFMAGGMSMTSLQVIPALITLTRRTAAADRSNTSRSANNGRLTPQPIPESERTGFNLAVPGSSPAPGTTSSSSNKPTSIGYELAAQQFIALSRTAAPSKAGPTTTSLAALSAPGLLTVLSSAYLAYHTRKLQPAARLLNYSNTTWRTWAAVAALMAVVIPLTGLAMAPIEHKIARVAGVEDKVEPYEDSPPDREVESANMESFLRKWNTWNSVRAAVALTAGALGLWAQVDRL